MSCREGWSEKKHSKCWDHKKHSKCWHDHDDDCWKEFKECKKDRNEKCDCCCTTGIFRRLRELRGRNVSLLLKGTTVIVTGVVESVNCDVVGIRVGTTLITVSLCEIIAIAATTTTATEISEELRNIFNGNN
ncbi:hypothetical protein [Bacillus cereus]|uniref:hypothetical protein n=1 Tax=Bacillus cereus TaxID=1396 RepID=UPI003980CE54